MSEVITNKIFFKYSKLEQSPRMAFFIDNKLEIFRSTNCFSAWNSIFCNKFGTRTIYHFECVSDYIFFTIIKKLFQKFMIFFYTEWFFYKQSIPIFSVTILIKKKSRSIFIARRTCFRSRIKLNLPPSWAPVFSFTPPPPQI